jgi:hypothetical protein
MKYEMIFGDEGLFDGAPEDVDMIGYSGGFYKNSPDGPMYCCGCTFTTDEYRNKGFIAMRRIIKEPKRWTVEDQKAGVLPEVGCVVMAIGANEVARIAAINNDSVCSVCVVFEDGGFITLHLSGIAPIETQDEKAQREEDEFVESTCRQNEPHSTLYSDGVRAAYRKLKGGE